MTEIDKAAEEYAKDYYGNFTFTETALCEKGFTAGAEYAAPKWVSCSERLPENEQWVIVAKKLNSGYDVMLQAHQFYKRINRMDNCFIPYGEPFGYTDLTHWMPLPTPPTP